MVVPYSSSNMTLMVIPLAFVFGQDYLTTSLPTAHLDSFCVLAHISTALNWEMEQLDIKMA